MHLIAEVSLIKIAGMNDETVSCRVTSAMLAYLEKHDRPALSALLSEIPFSEEYLRDTTNWVDRHLVAILFHRLEKRTGDGKIAVKIGMEAPLLHCLGPLDGVFRLVGSTHLLFEQGGELSRYFFRTAQVSVLECRDEWALMQMDPMLFPHEQYFLVGLLAGLPQYWFAGVAEYSCCGPDRYRFAWRRELSLFDVESIFSHEQFAKQTLVQLDSQYHRLYEKHGILLKHYRALRQIKVPLAELEEGISKLGAVATDGRGEILTACVSSIEEIKKMTRLHLQEGLSEGAEVSQMRLPLE